ncbi:hypothetical protein EDD16DRAFT_1522471 [Pisolithus croceorrhizus]|nr:hypothetical protein EV401DRAFT_1893936 [Pisolithus croceorrhizus]KAI6109430.1 hypothetical protein EDD16DRAFT_1522471 [Pisolithus croceorrhizus]
MTNQSGQEFGSVTRVDTLSALFVNEHEPVTSKIVLAYLATSEDGQIRLEQHYGRASLQRMERQHQENEENRKWLESSTTKCPGCALRKEYGLQSCASPGSVYNLPISIFSSDDVFKMQDPLLLPLWEQDISDEFVPTLFDVWNELLFEVIRLRAKRRGRLAANRGI